MSNIINVKEENNVLRFVGNVLNVVANSSNFYLKFDLDEEWEDCEFITVIFSFNGEKKYVELDENYECQIPPADSSKIIFCITAEPSENKKLSSTMLELNVEPSGDTNLEGVSFYEEVHGQIFGVLEDIKNGDIISKRALSADVSLSQVSLTGDETISGEKNFTGELLKNSKKVIVEGEVVNPNILINGGFEVNQRGKVNYYFSSVGGYCADRWQSSADQVVSYNDGVLMLSKGANITNTYIVQWIENPKKYIGEAVTLSFKVSGAALGDIWKIGVTNGDEEMFISGAYATSGVNVYNVTVTIPSTWTGEKVGVILYPHQNVSELVKAISVHYIKAEIGEISTPFVSKGYADEILKCKRFYNVIESSSDLGINVFAYGYSADATTIYATVPLSSNLRDIPTIKTNNDASDFVVIGNGEQKTPSNFEYVCHNKNSITFKFTITGGTADQVYVIKENAKITIGLDAEIQ